MRPFASTISLDEARRRLDNAVKPIDRTERVDLISAAGRVAACDVTSTIDVPPFARSAMDGYAVIASDTAGATRESPVRLRVGERIYTGQMPQSAVTTGCCAEIATGAPIPRGADAVVMVEETARAGDAEIAVLSSPAPGQHITPKGADIVRGAPVVARGDVLTPSRVGAVAAVGREAIEVYARPRVAILSTGNEVADPGRAISPGQIYDVNRFTLSAIVQAHGSVPEPQPSVPDTVDALAGGLARSSAADIIVFSGGSSVGERDLILDAIGRCGEMIFHGIAVKPGKPTAFAMVAGKPFFGMPGNPTSCLSNAYVLLVPFLRATARLPPFVPRIARVPLGRRIASTSGRHTFFTVRLDRGIAFPAFKGSGDVTSMSQADGYIEIPADRAVVEEGETVDVVMF